MKIIERQSYDAESSTNVRAGSKRASPNREHRQKHSNLPALDDADAPDDDDDEKPLPPPASTSHRKQNIGGELKIIQEKNIRREIQNIQENKWRN